MAEQTPAEKEMVIKSGSALIPTTKEETKALVLSAIRSAFSGAGQSIGVSRNWLIKHVDQLALKQHEVETLVTVRTEFRGLLPHAVKLLYQGLTVEEVYGRYRTQRALAELNGNKHYNASVKKISKLIRAFAEADPDNEGLYETIAYAHELISSRYFWVKYVDQSISILCSIADQYGCCTIDAALAMIDSRHPKRAGMLNGESSKDDEVERHRQEFENSNPNRYL